MFPHLTVGLLGRRQTALPSSSGIQELAGHPGECRLDRRLQLGLTLQLST
jgi:hypothetical protein